MKKFIEELKRRNVIKSALAYLVVAWILLQVFTILLPMLGAPEWLLLTLTSIMAIGLPIWIVISWVYDITPQGIEKTTKESGSELASQATSKRLNVFIIASLSIAVIVLTLKLTNLFDDDFDRQYAIAVLPFENVKVDKGNEYLSESFSLDVYSYISKVSQLQVTDFYTTKRYKDSKKTNTEIGKELDVIYLLRGTVRQINNNLSVTVELIDANTNKVVFTKSYDDIIKEKEILKLQQQVSQSIVNKLKIKLTPQEEKTIKKFPTENPEALYFFTKGREIVIQRHLADNWTKGLEYFKKAVALDSTYAEAYAEIAQAYLIMGLIGGESIDERINKINLYLDKASALNPNLFRVYAVKAMLIQGEDWKKGAEYFEKSITLNPNDASVHMQYGLHLRWKPVPNLEKSLEQFKIAQKLEPFTPQKNTHLFVALFYSGKVEEAEAFFNKMKFVWEKGRQLEYEGKIKAFKNKDWTAAVRFYEDEIKKDPNNIKLNELLASAYDEILNDDSNYIKYAKKAYELDSTNAGNARNYVSSLIEGKQFAAAYTIMQSKNFKLINNRIRQLESLWYYYYHQEKYKKAQEVLKDSLMKYNEVYQDYTYAQLGDRKRLVDSYGLYKGTGWYPRFKVFVYAILKDKDSMYHYLEKLSLFDAKMKVPNSRREFDPYRKEERFKEILRKHYLPITHWNE